AYRDTGGAVDEEIGDLGGEYVRNQLGAVIVFGKIDGLLVQIGHQVMRNPGHADFGITHGRRGIAVDGTEVTLAVHQPVAQGKVLGHPHNGVINRRVPVGVVFTDDIADNTGRLLVGFVPIVREHV